MSCDLELEIAPGAALGLFTVNVDSPAGAASGTARLDANGLLSRRPELAASVLASAVSTRTLSAFERPVREVGQALFAAVLTERIYGRYTASLQEAARRGEPLRVVLRLRAPELAALPWETLFDPETREYLCQREPVVRYVETAQPATPLSVNPPLRILGLIAAPWDLPRLDIEEEKRRLTDAVVDLTRQGQVELVWASGGSWPVLQQQLLAGPWHVVHFVGHGSTDPSASSGLLSLEDETTGQADWVSAERFARLLHTCRPTPRLVVLNSCQSGQSAVDDLLSSTAAALVHSGISAAVAMQFPVTDAAALAFARGFYQALARRNNPVDEAVRNGRIAIDGTSEHTMEWVTPVLYLRTDDTRLFTVQPTSDDVATIQPGNDVVHEHKGDAHRHTAPVVAQQHLTPDYVPQPQPQTINVGQSVDELVLSSDGNRLATRSHRYVRVWDLPTGQQLWAVRIGKWLDFPSLVAFTPDGRRLTIGTVDKVQVLDATTGAQLRTLNAHTVSPDGTRVVVLVLTGMAEIWDTTTSAEPVTVGVGAPTQ